MEMLKEAYLLRIFIGESDKHEGKPLYEWLVCTALKQQLAGATVLRGMMGFGSNSKIHSTRILRLSQDLPIVVEIVDTRDRLESYLETVEQAIDNGMATLEKVEVCFSRKKST
jgi:hypothetical protein